MFKKKKYVEPIKPCPRVLKQFNNYRLVETFVPEYDQVQYDGESSQRIIGYKSHLILEKKDTNAMSEPYYIKDCEDPGPKVPGLYYSSYLNVDDKRLMFQLFREMYC